MIVREKPTIELLNGDCRELLRTRADLFPTMITDPIWPNHQKVFDCDDSAQLLRTAIEACNGLSRVVIILGGDSDPRWLFRAVPPEFGFLKNCFLEFLTPVRKGRNLYTHLNAYCFGIWPKSKEGARVIPTKCLHRQTGKRLTWHPTPLRVTHCEYLVKWWSEGKGVIDPFAGSGSIGVACKRLNVPYLGIEINETYARLANKRIAETVAPMF